MLTNSNSIGYNPPRLQSATFPAINFPSQSTYMQPIRNPNQYTQNTKHQENYANYQSAIVVYIESKLHNMFSILANKLLFKTLKTSFDQIAFVSTLPKIKTALEKNIVDLLNNKLSSLTQITGNKLKENISFAFSRIMKTAAGTKKGGFSNNRYPEIMKQNQGYNNISYNDPNGRNKKVGQQVQISFINNMHKLLDSHFSVFNPEVNRNPQRGSISPISPGLDKARFQSDRSKPKFAIKKQ